MPSGLEMLELARTRVGQQYRNILVPKNNPDWQGPWDCAEFMSWLVYQVSNTKYLYGCFERPFDPALVEAYTGAWQRDSEVRGIRAPVAQAAGTVGAILLRYPPSRGKMGHIALSDGKGKVVEAHSRKYGVTDHFPSLEGRRWDVGILIPGFDYDTSTALARPKVSVIYRIGGRGMKVSIVREIQRAVRKAGFDPGPMDGIFGPNTAAAVAAYQADRELLVDGEVGPDTARHLKVKLS